MNYYSVRSRLFVVLFVSCLVCAACQVEGGVTVVPTAVQRTAVPAATSAAQVAAVAARNDTWTIGTLDQPPSLSPYQPTATDQRRAAPIVELLFPSPLLTYNYAYTTTGVLEQLPLIENGGASVRKTDVFLDAAGVITTTATDVITQVDQIVVTYYWNPDLAWSDGTPVTAADSVFAYEYARDNLQSEEVQGKLAQLDSYTAVDEHTTQAVLRPDVIGPTYFQNYWTPLPRHVLAHATPEQWAAFEQQPIGYGPYMIEQADAEAIRMVQNPYYFGQAPATNRLDVLFAQSLDQLRANIANGRLDVVLFERVLTEEIVALDKDTQDGVDQVSYAPTPIWEHIDFNLDVELLQDFKVRRAIAFGTNRQQMAQEILGNHVSVLDSWVLPFQPEAAPADQLSRYEYNPDQARALLEEAGYTDPDGDGIRASPDGLTLTLQLLTSAESVLRGDIAERFKANMRDIGIDVEITLDDSATIFAPDGPLYQRQFEMALYGWKADLSAGGLSLWNCNSIPTPENNFQGENFSGWCFRDADMAIRRGATTLNLEERKALYLKQQQIWTQELPGLPLFQRLSAIVVANGIVGPKADTFAPATWNITQWQRQ